MDYHLVFKQHFSYTIALSFLSFSPSLLYASPWLDPGDIQLRHELQLLSDEGIINTPLTTWPLSTKDIHAHMVKPNKNQVIKPELQKPYNYINNRLEDEDYGSRFKVGGSAFSKKLLIRDFSGEGRETALAYYDGQWGDPLVDIRLKATLANKSNHKNDKTFRFDESYLAGSFDNWKFTIGRQSRWWGPGWDGSLILSNNARPISSISIDRIEAEPFKNKYLKWMGPWKLSLFGGRLEAERAIPKANLLGARLNFKPSPNFEVGFSRTALWGGNGRPRGFTSLFETIVGKNEFGSTSGKIKDPRNQLVGIDFRWKSPLATKKPFALYGQFVGENTNGLLPSRSMGLLGIETWGTSKALDGSVRVYFEVTDTTVNSPQGKNRNNTAYNHSVYKNGYRHQNLSLGHSIDSGSKLYSAGLLLSKNNGDFWRISAKHAKLNINNIGKNPTSTSVKQWTSIGATFDRNLNKRTKLNLGLQLVSEKTRKNRTNNDAIISIGFTRYF